MQNKRPFRVVYLNYPEGPYLCAGTGAAGGCRPGCGESIKGSGVGGRVSLEAR